MKRTSEGARDIFEEYYRPSTYELPRYEKVCNRPLYVSYWFLPGSPFPNSDSFCFCRSEINRLLSSKRVKRHIARHRRDLTDRSKLASACFTVEVGLMRLINSITTVSLLRVNLPPDKAERVSRGFAIGLKVTAEYLEALVPRRHAWFTLRKILRVAVAKEIRQRVQGGYTAPDEPLVAMTEAMSDLAFSVGQGEVALFRAAWIADPEIFDVLLRTISIRGGNLMAAVRIEIARRIYEAFRARSFAKTKRLLRSSLPPPGDDDDGDEAPKVFHRAFLGPCEKLSGHPKLSPIGALRRRREGPGRSGPGGDAVQLALHCRGSVEPNKTG